MNLLVKSKKFPLSISIYSRTDKFHQRKKKENPKDLLKIVLKGTKVTQKVSKTKQKRYLINDFMDALK